MDHTLEISVKAVSMRCLDALGPASSASACEAFLFRTLPTDVLLVKVQCLGKHMCKRSLCKHVTPVTRNCRRGSGSYAVLGKVKACLYVKVLVKM